MYASKNDDGSIDVKMSEEEFTVLYRSVLWVDSGMARGFGRIGTSDVFSSMNMAATDMGMEISG